MEDDNTIAILYPVPRRGHDEAKDSILEQKNTCRYVSPRNGNPKEEDTSPTKSSSRSSASSHFREAEAPEPSDSDGGLEDKPGLRLTFSEAPKSQRGFVCGLNPDCDLPLISESGVSNYHIALRFEGHYFYVEDLNSANGTAVIYDNSEDKRPRSGGKWIIGGHEYLKNVKVIIIQLSRRLKFQIVVPPRDFSSAIYQQKIAAFSRGTLESADLFQGLNFSSVPLTRDLSDFQTPAKCNDAMLVRKTLGAGGFGVAEHVWNSRTGDSYVEKKPKDEDDYDQKEWQREAAVMRRANHERIVKFLGFEASPHPIIRLEYLPEGSLADHLKNNKNRQLSPSECGQVTWQISEALAYLHESDPMIVARDVSATNILVDSRHNGEIWVKLTDFGLANRSPVMYSICGNYPFMAPELWAATVENPGAIYAKDPYTAAVDVYSLASTVVWLLRCQPRSYTAYRSQGLTWCKLIQRNFTEYCENSQDKLGQFVLNKMLCMDPSARASAIECYKTAHDLVTDGELSTVPYKIATAPVTVDSESGEDEQTMVDLGTPSHSIIGSRTADSVEDEDDQTTLTPGTLNHYIARHRKEILTMASSFVTTTEMERNISSSRHEGSGHCAHRQPREALINVTPLTEFATESRPSRGLSNSHRTLSTEARNQLLAALDTEAFESPGFSHEFQGRSQKRDDTAAEQVLRELMLEFNAVKSSVQMEQGFDPPISFTQWLTSFQPEHTSSQRDVQGLSVPKSRQTLETPNPPLRPYETGKAAEQDEPAEAAEAEDLSKEPQTVIGPIIRKRTWKQRRSRGHDRAPSTSESASGATPASSVKRPKSEPAPKKAGTSKSVTVKKQQRRDNASEK